MTATPLYIALSAILIVILTARIIRMRWHYKISLGSADNNRMERAVRAHANATETLPIALLLFAGLEMTGVGPAYIHILGCLLMIGRVLHAYQISFEKQLILRIIGMSLTLTVIGLCAIVLLYTSLT